MNVLDAVPLGVIVVDQDTLVGVDVGVVGDVGLLPHAAMTILVATIAHTT